MAHDPIAIALREIYHNIPEDILHMAFRPDVKQTTLDDCIHEEIIVNRVLQDCNIVGGKVKYIPLQQNWMEITEPMYGISGALSGQTGVYRIPPAAREHKSIVAVIDLKPPQSLMGLHSIGLYNNCSSGSAGQLACQALNSALGVSGMATPTVELLAGDVVRIQPPQVLAVEWVLHARLSFDENFTNLTPNSIRRLVALIMCATKTYIYNKLIINIDRAFITGGAEIGVLKSIVESYSDQAERYHELLVQFQGSSYFSGDRIQNILRHFVK